MPQRQSTKMGTDTKPASIVATKRSPRAPPFGVGTGLVVLGPGSGLEHPFVVCDPEAVADGLQPPVPASVSKVAVTPVELLHKDGTAAAGPATNLTATH